MNIVKRFLVYLITLLFFVSFNYAACYFDYNIYCSIIPIDDDDCVGTNYYLNDPTCGAGVSCSYNGGTLANGASNTLYSTPQVTSPDVCGSKSKYVTCNNGVFLAPPLPRCSV